MNPPPKTPHRRDNLHGRRSPTRHTFQRPDPRRRWRRRVPVHCGGDNQTPRGWRSALLTLGRVTCLGICKGRQATSASWGRAGAGARHVMRRLPAHHEARRPFCQQYGLHILYRLKCVFSCRWVFSNGTTPCVHLAYHISSIISCVQDGPKPHPARPVADKSRRARARLFPRASDTKKNRSLPLPPLSLLHPPALGRLSGRDLRSVCGLGQRTN